LKVLIADDEPNIVTSLEFLMRRKGHEVRVARDGEQALAAVAEWGPDVVLLDVMMPRKNGYEVCQEMRASPEWRDIKVMMLTAKGREVEMVKGLSLGADAYVTKPFSTRELVEQVERLAQGEG
jgi:DNA-binding response OmpR family regulator